jgi:uncharacterized membrane protein YoaK (UPF0700 family)
MFIIQAHSFVQQARLAITLAWVAGYTNILTILVCGHVTSHVSGTTSDLGKGVASGQWGLAALSMFLLVTFLIGAAISGLTTEFGRRRGWESIYVLPMTVEALLLAAFAIMVEFHDLSRPETGAGLYVMTGLASMAMGLQNATITRISSGVVRTTHVTGVLTDLGLEVVQFLLWLKDSHRDVPPGSPRALFRSARAHPTTMRLLLLASIIGSFALGAALGTVIFGFAPSWSMFPPVMFLLWIIFQDIRRPIVEIEPSDLVSDGQLGLDERLAVFHLKRDKGRQGRVHRMPNLLVWAERLPAIAKVVILDLGEVRLLDANSALEICALLRLTRRQARELILSGLTNEQFEQLRKAGAGDGLDYEHVCPDLELAIARGMNMLEDMSAHHRPVGGLR